MRRLSATLLVAAALQLLGTTALGAQEDTSTAVRVGTRVRVSTGSRVRHLLLGADADTRGTIVALQSDSLAIERDGDSSVVTVARDAIWDMYVSRGRGSRVRTAIGASAAMAVVGGLVIFAEGEYASSQLGGAIPTGDYLKAAAACGAVGFAMGFALGGQERWQQVPLPNSVEVGWTGGSLIVARRFTF